MTRGKARFIHGPIEVARDRLRVMLNSAPEIAYVSASVVYGFNLPDLWSSQKDCARSKKRFNVIRDIA
jgi:hypothetical protein